MRHIGSLVGLMTAVAVFGAPDALLNPALGAAQDPSCAPQGNVRFVCGRGGPEDLAPLVGTDWAIASAYTGAIGLHLINTRTVEEVAVLYPIPDEKKKQDMATYGSCPGPLSAEGDVRFVSHGLNIRKVNDRLFTLYVVYHGERESIEIFNLDLANGRPPVATWVGCAVAPGSAVFNAVVPLPGEGFIATNTREKKDGWKPVTHFSTIFGDPLAGSTSADFQKRQAAGENTNDALEWHSKSGWTKVPGSNSRLNGIEVSQDGKTLFIINGTKLMRLSRGVNPPKKDEVDFGSRGDNVKWSADGKKLLLPGTFERADGLTGSKIMAVDPNTLAVSQVGEVAGPTQTAIGIGNDIWLTSVQGQRLIVVPMPAGR